MKSYLFLAMFSAVICATAGCGDKATFATKQDIKDLQDKANGSAPLEKPVVSFIGESYSDCPVKVSEVWIYEVTQDSPGLNLAEVDATDSAVCTKLGASGVSAAAYSYQGQWIYSDAGLQQGKFYKLCTSIEAGAGEQKKLMSAIYNFKYDVNIPVTMELKAKLIKQGTESIGFCDVRLERKTGK